MPFLDWEIVDSAGNCNGAEASAATGFRG